MNKKLEEMDINELKALAYDQINAIDQCQNNLRVINLEIKKRDKYVVPVQGNTQS